MCLRVFVCDWRTWLKRIWTEGREGMIPDGYFLEERYTIIRGWLGIKRMTLRASLSRFELNAFDHSLAPSSISDRVRMTY